MFFFVCDKDVNLGVEFYSLESVDFLWLVYMLNFILFLEKRKLRFGDIKWVVDYGLEVDE